MIAAGQGPVPADEGNSIGALELGWREEQSIGTNGYHVARA